MNPKDIDRIHAAGLITAEQRQAIIDHFPPDKSQNKLLLILSIIGGIMVAAGLILVMAANWQHIPDVIKLAAGVVLLVGCQLGGWQLRRAGRFTAAAEGLNLTGSLLFLGNIALIGQVFNLSSRPQNALLVWAIGIAPTAFLLRSKAQHILTLLAVTIWLGYEVFGTTGWIHPMAEHQVYLFMILCAYAFAAIGVWLKPETFGPATEKHGLLLIHLMTFPLTLPFFSSEVRWTDDSMIGLLAATAVAVGLLVWGILRNFRGVPGQWRTIWAGALTAVLATAWLGLAFGESDETYYGLRDLNGAAWIASIVLFVFCLLQVHLGLLRQNPWLVNVGIVFIAVHLITAYIKLFGTMLTTGTVFIVGGAFLIALAIYLEKKRRRLLGQISAAPVQPSN